MSKKKKKTTPNSGGYYSQNRKQNTFSERGEGGGKTFGKTQPIPLLVKLSTLVT